MSKVEIATIMRDVAATGTLSAPLEQWKIINSIINCRTAALGGHLYRCNSCGKEQPQYNSCRNRHCPKCQGGNTAKWLEKRAAELLPVPYFHIVFTLPHEFNSLVLFNKKVVLDILFKAASETLREVAKKRLGGKIGFFGVLHSWGQKLEFHPHLHLVVPGVVMKPDDTIEKTSSKFFLPQKVLSLVFRAVFIKLLRRAYQKKEISYDSFDELISVVKKKEWISYAKKPFSGPETVLKYLSCYTHRIAISNTRLLEYKNGKVTFSYKDYSDNCTKKQTTLSASEFIRRFLLHVLPKQFVRIRHFGFLANGVRTKALRKLRAALGVKETNSLLLSPCSEPQCIFCGKTALQCIAEIKPCYTTNPHKTKELPFVA